MQPIRLVNADNLRAVGVPLAVLPAAARPVPIDPPGRPVIAEIAP